MKLIIQIRLAVNKEHKDMCDRRGNLMVALFRDKKSESQTAYHTTCSKIGFALCPFTNKRPEAELESLHC